MTWQQLRRFNQARAAAGEPVAVTRDPYCRFLGEFEQHVPCRCPRSQTVPAFECAKHQLATLQRRAKDRSIGYCDSPCPDYQPRTESNV